MFMQDGASSHTTNDCQDLTQKLGDRYIKKTEWPRDSPDCNPLDYYFWDTSWNKVYENQREPSETLDDLKKKIKDVWKDVAGRTVVIRKAIDQFRPRLRAVVANEGKSIKNPFG